MRRVVSSFVRVLLLSAVALAAAASGGSSGPGLLAVAFLGSVGSCSFGVLVVLGDSHLCIIYVLIYVPISATCSQH